LETVLSTPEAHDILILGGTDAEGIAGVNSLIHQVRESLSASDGCRLSAVYFAPADNADNQQSADEVAIAAILDKVQAGSFHLQRIDARHIPIPNLQQHQLPYLLLHQHLLLDQLCRSISLQVHEPPRGIHTVMHAHTPGPFGYAMRRIANVRGFPLVASHHSAVRTAIEESTASLLQNLRSNTLPLDQIVNEQMFRELFPFLAANPDLLGPITEIARDARLAVRHLLREHSPFTRRIGKMLFWMGQRLNPWVYDKVEGGKCVMNIHENVRSLISRGIERYGLDESLKKEAIDPLVHRAVRYFVQRYLHWFYRTSQIVLIADEGEATELRNIGVPEERVLLVRPESPESAGSLMHAACNRAEALRRQLNPRIPNVQSLSNFQWKARIPGYPEFTSFCSISDAHLGDGDSFDRMEAIAELYPLIAAKGVHHIVYNGDFAELSASTKKYVAHRDRFNWVRQFHLEGVPSEGIPPIADACITIAQLDDGEFPKGRRDTMFRQLVKAAARAGLTLRIRENRIGILLPQPAVSSPELSTHGVRVRMNETILHGNHDEGIVLTKEFPGVREASSLIHYEEEMGAVFTHGHILGLEEFQEALQDARNPEELSEALTRAKMQAPLKIQEVIYDVMTLFWRYTENAVNGRWLWKHGLQPAISSLVQHTRRRRAGQTDISQRDESRAQFWESLLSPADDVLGSAALAAAVHSPTTPCWISCNGHSHLPDIGKKRVRHPRSGRIHTKVIVNSGKFHGELATAAIVNFPEVTIFSWSRKDKEWRLHMYACLTPEEIAEVLDPDGEEPSAAAPRPAPEAPLKSGVVLHGVPTEGDGHISAFVTLYPEYRKHGVVATVLSGPRSMSLDLPGGVHYRCTGLRLCCSEDGGIDLAASAQAYIRDVPRVVREARQLAPVIRNFQAIVSDYEPTLKLAYEEAHQTAKNEWRLSSFPELWSVSHQAAIDSTQHNVPRPRTSPMHDLQQHVIDMMRGTKILGLHFERYNDDAIELPLIRPEVMDMQPTFDGKFILVYVRGSISGILEQIDRVNLPVEWKVYNSHVTAERKVAKNTWVYPVNRDTFTHHLRHCNGVVANAGFSLPSEVLHVGLPAVFMPIPRHFEQAANAVALRHISNVGLAANLQDDETPRILQRTLGETLGLRKPLERAGITGPIKPYRGVSERIVERVLNR
jgi:uncharacterized protein (TIGR00661 family)